MASSAEQLSRLANEQFKQKKYDMSSESYEKLLNMRKAQCGSNNYDNATFITMNNLSMSYIKEKRYEDAKNLITQLLDIRDTQLGSYHQDTLQTLFDLSCLLCTQLNQYDDAELLITKYLNNINSPTTATAKESGTLDNNNKILIAKTNLGIIYYKKNKLNEALDVFQDIVKQRKLIQQSMNETNSVDNNLSTYTANNNQLQQSITTLADIYFKLNQYSQAELLHQESLNFKISSLGPQHIETITAMTNFAKFCQITKNYTLAISIYIELLNTKKATHKNEINHEEVYPLLYQIAQLYYIQKDYNNAILYYKL